jgi:hypothetical protein
VLEDINGTDELNIQHAILQLMRDGKIWSNAELKFRLAKLLPLTADDRKRSPKRPNEAVWENRVNNALSPSRKSSLYSKGHVENAGHGRHKITAKGLSYINEDFDLDELFKGLER